MKDLFKIFWLVAVMTLGSMVASAQYYTVEGFSPVTMGTSATYSYSIDPADAFDTFFISPYWDAPGGTITSSYLSNGNLTANVVVQWTVTGTFSVYFYGFNSSPGRPPSGTKVVTVNCLTIGTPTGTSQLSPICGSGSTQLSASVGSNGTSLRWYAAASGGSPLPSGVTYTTPSISSSTTYYVSSYNGGCESSRVPVTATVTNVPSAPTSLGGARCGTGQVVISATPPAGASISWENSGGTVLATGSSYTTPSHSTNTTYYARSYVSANGGNCYSATRTPVVAAINPIPAAPIAVDPIQICSAGTVTLIGDVGLNGNSLRWYTASSGGSPISAVQTVSSTTTFWGSSYNTNTGCESTSRLSANVTLTPPGLPTNTQQNASICGSGSTLISAAPGVNSNSLRWYTNSTGGSPLSTSTSYQTPTISTNTTYYISSYNASIGCESARIPITATISPIPGDPIMTDAARCGSGSVMLTGTPGTNANTLAWYSAAEGLIVIETTFFNTPSLSTTRQYKAKSISNDGCFSPNFIPVNAIINPTIAIPSVTPASRCGEGSVTLSASPGSEGTGIQWESSSGTVLGTVTTFTTPSLSVTTDYYVRSMLVAGGTCLSDRILVKATINPIPPATTDPESVGSSYVHGHGRVILSSFFYSKWYTAPAGGTYLGEGYFIETNDLSSPTNFYLARYDPATQCEGPRAALLADIRPLISNGSIKTENIRISGVTQDNQIAALTDAEKSTVMEHYDGLLRTVQQTLVRGSVSGKDIVQPIEYDEFGRTPKQYLPYVSAGTTGSYRPAYVTEQLNFYNTSNDKIANDAAPFIISKFEASPTGRILEQGGVGTGFQPGETVPHTAKASYSFNTGATNSEAEEVRKFNSDGSSSGFYAANILSRNETTDPDGNKIISFTDGTGKTIVTKQQFDAASYLQTYYIYDDFGRIKYIVSPKGVSELRTNGWALTPILKQFVHQFVYDARGRLIEKKVPGKDWEYFVYDKYDRLVLTQDSILRVSKQWIFQKYDIYGRAVMQGLYTNTVQLTRPLIETLVSGLYKTSNGAYPASARYEDRGTTLQGYTNVSFPKTNQNGSALTVTQVNYYDTYDFDFNGTADFSYTPQGLPGEGTAPQGSSEGMPTGIKTLVLGTSIYLVTYVFYDKYGRVIQKRSNNHLSTTADDVTTNVYDFEGKVITSRKFYTNTPDVTHRYEYDTHGKLNAIYGPSPLPEPVQWIGGVNVTITGNQLQKNTTTAGWDAGAISTNSLAAGENGRVEFRVGETNTAKKVGFSASNTHSNAGSFNFAIYATNNGGLRIYENGAEVVITGTYTVNDILSVERRNGTIIYRKNFVILYISTVSNTGPLYVDCSIHAPNAIVKNVNLFRANELKMVQYEYNELGQLVDKKLHNTSGNDFLQSVDYRYNIRGQLTSINNAPLTNDGDLNDETTDHFGLEMMYHTTDAGLSNTPYYNGNISAIKWKGVGLGTGNAGQRSYQYTYDKANRLLSASSKMNSGSAWNKELNAFNESMTYDHNGNILSLQRNDRQHLLTGVTASYSSQQIDNLAYGYDVATGDRLKNVEDASAQAAGFSNVVNANTIKEFTYDGNGNVTADANKGITVTYNYLGKPTVINFSGGKKIEYTYDGAGNKLRMRTLQGTTPLDTTDYVGDYVYDGGKLKYFGSPEGRTIMNGGKPEYQYAIADHQGNTRVVFTSAALTPSAPVATFEGNATDQSSQYTMGGDVVTFFAANHTPPSGTKVVRMNQTTPIGPSKSLKVYPGDKVDLEVWSYFEGSSGWGSSNTGMSALITNVATAFGGVSGGAGESGTIYSGVNTAYTTIGTAGNQGDAAPSAYLNYILYDKDYKFLNAGWRAIKPNAFTQDSIRFSTLNIKEPGYVFVYLSYEGESNQYVYFDDFKVTHTKTNVIQYNEYYPFGLLASTSWTREGNKNDFMYNAGSELNVTSGWYDLPFRNYDPALGRFMQVDPLAASEMATYQYAGNNPVLFNDPMGAAMARPSWNRAYWMSNGMVESESRGNLPTGLEEGGGGGHWSDSYRSVEMNAALMSQGSFDNFYGLSYGIGGEDRRGDLANRVQSSTGYMTYVQDANGNIISDILITLDAKPIKGLGDPLKRAKAQQSTLQAGFGFGEGLGSLELALAGLKPTFDNASRLAKSAGGVGNVPLFLWKRSFGKGLRLETNKALFVGRVSSTTAIGTANAFNKLGSGLAVVGVVTNGYDIIKDGKLTAGDGFQAVNTGLMIAFPVYGVVYGVVDLGFGLFSDQSLTDRIKLGIDSNVSGSIAIPKF